MEVDTQGECSSSRNKKPPKRGIIFLSSIPPYLNVSQIHQIFSEYGKVGRVYLHMQKKDGEKKKKFSNYKNYTEGWVEFERKSVAKKVAELLNNAQVSSRKKSKQFDCTWNIKYLTSFKWTHLHERLAYERAARKQKLRAEVELAKKKTNYFTSNLHKSKNVKDDANVKLPDENTSDKDVEEKQDEPRVEENRKDFLKSLFQ